MDARARVPGRMLLPRNALAVVATQIWTHMVSGALLKIGNVKNLIGVTVNLKERTLHHGSSKLAVAQTRLAGRILMGMIATTIAQTIGAIVTVATTSDGTKSGELLRTSQVAQCGKLLTKLAAHADAERLVHSPASVLLARQLMGAPPGINADA